MAERLDPLVEFADALDRTDDFVSGVVGLAEGRLGGGSPSRSPVGGRLVSALSWFGSGSLASRLAASHGPEQLRKAALEADRAVMALDLLRRERGWEPLVAKLDDLGIASLPERIRGVDPRSSDLRSVHLDLQRAAGAVAEARSRRLIAEWRRSRQI